LCLKVCLLYDCDMPLKAPPGQQDPLRWKHAFIESLRTDSLFQVLFDHLHNVCLFAKDREGRLLVVNRALVERFGLSDESHIIGKTDFDLHPGGHARKYREDDLRVMETGRSMLNIIELFLDLRGVPTWHVTNKMPAIGRDGRVVGVMGTIETYENRTTIGITSKSLLKAYEYLRTNSSGPISIRKLAADCGLSVRQFERKFREQVWTTPRELIIRMRVQRACDLLRQTSTSLSDVALACGFYDQADFNRHFKKHLGLTPGEYRRRYG